jgi:type IV secretory pathway protease TraF
VNDLFLVLSYFTFIVSVAKLLRNAGVSLPFTTLYVKVNVLSVNNSLSDPIGFAVTVIVEVPSVHLYGSPVTVNTPLLSVTLLPSIENNRV